MAVVGIVMENRTVDEFLLPVASTALLLGHRELTVIASD
jgi:hypothetical protein